MIWTEQDQAEWDALWDSLDVTDDTQGTGASTDDAAV